MNQRTRTVTNKFRTFCKSTCGANWGAINITQTQVYVLKYIYKVMWRRRREFGSCYIRQRSANTHVLLVTGVLGSLQEGAEWSVIWSTVCPPACATPPPRDTVHEPDSRWGYRNSKQVQQLEKASSATLTVFSQRGGGWGVNGSLNSDLHCQ
jgi:hypothetical protein